MSDDEKELEDGDAALNPDLLEDGLGEEEVVDEEELDGDISLEKAAEEEDEEGLLADSYDDEKDLW